MYRLIRAILFLIPAEMAHRFTTGLLRKLISTPGIPGFIRSCYHVNGNLSRNVMGLHFPNPIGLAAGFDKNGTNVREWGVLGFGFVEVGTVTPRAQPGNEPPRLFRLKADNALINRMGFNNNGLESLIDHLKDRPSHILVGGNIGKNKTTANDEAVEDYLVCFRKLHPYVDYFVVNVSSPNTPHLRELQDKKPLTDLLQNLADLNNTFNYPKPILLKIAPDLSTSQLDDILDILKETGVSGVVATNTTVDRSGLRTSPIRINKIGPGGLSGAPLCERSTEIIRYLRKRNSDLVIIGVGGIDDVPSALEKLNAGADLIQLYTGFVYQGPALLKRIKKALVRNFDEA